MNTKNVIAVAVAALGLTAGAAGLATAGPGETRPQAASTSTSVAEARPHRPGRAHAGPLARAVHGELIVRAQDGFENVLFDRGTLTSADAGSLTLHRPDDVDVTVKLTDQTRFIGVEDADALEDGKPVTVVHKDGTARAVMQRDPDAHPGPGARRPGRSGARPEGGPDRPAAPAAPAA